MITPIIMNCFCTLNFNEKSLQVVVVFAIITLMVNAQGEVAIMAKVARKAISAEEVELYINGLMARWSQIHGKQALQLLKIAEQFTRAEMSGSAEKLRQVAGELDAWCSVYFDDTADWQRLKTYVRVQRHKAAHGQKKGATSDLFTVRKAQAQSAADRLADGAYGEDNGDFD